MPSESKHNNANNGVSKHHDTSPGDLLDLKDLHTTLAKPAIPKKAGRVTFQESSPYVSCNPVQDNSKSLKKPPLLTITASPTPQV